MQPLVYAAVCAVGIAAESMRLSRQAELSRAEVQSQLGALRAQLHPHFLLNTLNAGVALARMGDTAGTARILTLLGELLRRLLDTEAPDEIPLSEELELSRAYAEIQGIRFGAKLRMEWEIPETLLRVRVP